MELTVFLLQLAENKLDDIYEYYKFKANKRVAKRIVTAIADKTDILAKQLEIGQIETYLSHRLVEYRYLVQDNYKIVYWNNKSANRVEIANVFDTRQNPVKMDETR